MNHNTIAMNENESHDESSSAKGAGTVGINYDAFDPPGFSLKQYAQKRYSHVSSLSPQHVHTQLQPQCP